MTSNLILKMDILGEAFDYANRKYQISLNDFYELFAQSEIARGFEHNDWRYTHRLTGAEIVERLLKHKEKEIIYTMEGSTMQYWCGSILAYFQDKSKIPFKDIYNYFLMSDLSKFYSMSLSEEQLYNKLITFNKK